MKVHGMKAGMLPKECRRDGTLLRVMLCVYKYKWSI